MATTRATTDEMKLEAVDAARAGMSLEGVAHLIGCSRQHLWRARKEDPDFNADLMRALALYEQEMLLKMNGLGDGAGLAKAILVQRFPQRHGSDPRMRLSTQQAQEGYEDDLDDPKLNPAVESTAAVIGRLVDRMLTEDEEKS